MNMDKTKLALIVLCIVIVAELALVGVLAWLGVPTPDQAWAIIYATLGVLAGVAGAQVANGRMLKSKGG